MLPASKIKLIFLLLVIFSLFQKFITPVYILGIFSFISFFLYLSFRKKIGNIYLFLPFLFLFLLLRLWENSPISTQEHNNWYQERRIYVKAQIIDVLKAGRYLAKFQVMKFSPKKKNKKTSYTYKGKYIVYLKIDDYYLWNGCELWLKLEDFSFPQKLPKNKFSKYLRDKGVSSIVKFKRKNVFRKTCQNMDFRGRFHSLLVKALYKAGFSLKESGVALGLLLGRSSYIPYELKKDTRELGILHLFAASGLHMGIFYLCFFAPLSLIWGRKSKLALIFPLLPCFFYMHILGFPISLLRAFTFLSLHALQSILYRKLNIHDLLLNTAIIVLFLNPKQLLGIGSLLSFGAVTGILYFYPILWKEFSRLLKNFPFPKLGKVAIQQMLISLSVGIFTLPTLLYVFSAYPYISLFANVVFVPLVGFFMPFLIISVFLAILSNFHILWLGQLAQKLTAFFVYLVEFFSYSNLYISYPTWLCLPFFANLFLFLSLCTLLYYQKKEIKKKYLYRFSLTGILVCTLLLSPINGFFIKYKDIMVQKDYITKKIKAKRKIKNAVLN